MENTIMATSRSMQKEISALRKEIASLRDEYVKTGRKTAAAASNGAERIGAIKDEIVERVAGIKDTIAEGAGDMAGDVVEQLDELRAMLSDYENRAEKAVSAHPFATVAGAVAIGYLIGRFSR
jgi:ElaB/YqjD/DUF883 family membrane-anchored ribosome-binding protein